MNSQKQLETHIVINAPRKQVWSVLTELEHYSEWNPFIISSIGRANKGNRIKNTMKNGNKQMTFSPTITQLKENEIFEWLGHLFVPGIFDGRHYFKLEAIDSNSTRLIQGEYFSGILSGIILKSIKENTLDGFKSMNHALKNRVESI
ncbi:MAG: polyketide cyclase/dehydrase [Crocinitomicaceae bacterium]|nr:polyketide cyclase/dehydrase [Crocinitomicaceae bacterium]|tara:strand:+ start:22161 stop:22601 length:441 start_codon:yes stop_codon:yes gene_type:complete